MNISKSLKPVLSRIDKAILALIDHDSYKLCEALHHNIAEAMSLHSFYVAFIIKKDQLIYPYNFDGKMYDEPNIRSYPPDGVTAQLVRTNEPYFSEDDGGALLHKGNRYGTDRLSQSAIVAPIIAVIGKRGLRTIGVIAVMSYDTNVYTANHVEFMQSVGRIYGMALQRSIEDTQRQRGYAASDLQDPLDVLLPEVQRSTRAISEIRRRVLSLSGGDRNDLGTDLEALVALCDQAMTEAYDSLVRRSFDRFLPVAKLTSQQLIVAQLVANDLTDDEIANKLSLSPFTVKTHVHNIASVLGTKGRGAIAVLFRAFDTPSE